tara:strand:+ start:417 stop:923 length:507 start_codon:yes stop_codon:yes gene_type:complete
MIKKIFLVIAFVFSSSLLLAQDLSYPRLGVGIQTSFPAGGLSVKADLTEQHSAQAVIGIFGPFSSYYGRYSFNFNESGYDFRIKPYLYGQGGLFSYTYKGIDLNTFEVVDETESNFGYGVGAGIEWHYAPFTDKLRFNIEIGYGNVDFAFYDFKSILFGGGIHYYFDI